MTSSSFENWKTEKKDYNEITKWEINFQRIEF